MMSNQTRIGEGGGRRVAHWLVVAALVLGAPAGALAQGGSFVSPLIIPAAEFESSAVDSYGTLDRFSNTSGYFYATSDDLTCVMAPVYLPNGVTITRFEAAMADLVSYNPSSTSTCPKFYPDVEVDLMSNQMDDNLYAQDTHVITGQMHIVSDTTINTPVVNNLQQIYWVRVYVCGSFQAFQGVRIFYEE
jgi:hypothetical protein